MTSRKHFVYQIRDSKGNVLYVGRSLSPKDRFKRFVVRTGITTCNIEIVSSFDNIDEACEAERELIKALRPSYNQKVMSAKGFFEHSHALETRIRLHVAMSGAGNPMFGKPAPTRGVHRSPEFCKRMSEKRLGSGNPMFGKSGELSPTAKLNREDVAELRRLYVDGERKGNLQSKFKISKSTLNRVLRGASWAEKPDYQEGA